MADHWRSGRPGAEVVSGIGAPAARYVTSWALSLALTVATLLEVWRLQMYSRPPAGGAVHAPQERALSR